MNRPRGAPNPGVVVTPAKCRIKSNTIDSVNVNQGDLMSFKFTETGGVTNLALYFASFEFK